ncbi:hypothetical protein NCAS_0A11180 [Naumovozyma castellii]|uniref:histone deacetylase n=1 Tax=Naumovozyma castellii TaxID=27288 RepID=G0V878_NAUCA|nr:hypothetical protein NCAS_0A11180 [Naumovozyma castellii CBS 4309]CCC67676.1 hypothetical protein NCAS_0A11180 [Naumovozyma castellii CBS 4309]
MTRLVISTSTFQSQVADLLPCNKYKKSQLTHSLIESTGLLNSFDHVISDFICSKDDLLQFHSKDYIELLMDNKYNTVLPYDVEESSWNELNEISTSWHESKNEAEFKRFTSREKLYEHFKQLSPKEKPINGKRSAWDALLDSDPDEEVQQNETLEGNAEIKATLMKEHNLEGDCPLFSYIPMYTQVVTGATLSLSKFLQPNSERSIAINWDGGRHHAFKNKASGFCYVNDIVLLIQKIRKNGFKNISYVDFDLHHGDGVQKAFQFSKNVQTVSLHMFEPGFFPCTGSLQEAKAGSSIVNIPLLHGLDGTFLKQLTKDIIIPVVEQHEPEVLVIQCGGDGLIGDQYNEWQLTIHDLSGAIMKLINTFPSCSVVLLGGGGYNEKVMSRFYNYLTWNIAFEYSKRPPSGLFLSSELNLLIPDHEFIDVYQDEQYKYWIYEQEGSSKYKTLRNDNKVDFVAELRAYYGHGLQPQLPHDVSEDNSPGTVHMMVPK